MDAEQDSEGAQRHTDGAESKWRMVLEKEADVQTFDEQISEIHTAEHRAATISMAGVLAIMIVAAYCTAAEGCPWRGAADSLGFWMIWHAAAVLTCVAWMGSWFWKQEQKLHDMPWPYEAITSMMHLLPLLTALGHLVVYSGCLRAKIRVSELELRYTVPEGKGGDGAV
jgi:hypothetical protein